MARDMPREAADALREREALITGRAPRIGPLAPDEYPPHAVDLVAAEREVAGVGEREAGDDRPLSDHAATLLRNPELYAAQMGLGLQLSRRGRLDARDRELAVLRTGWLCQAPYEWGEHVEIAKQIGLTGEEIERVKLGSQAPGWDAHEAAILAAAEELHFDAMISDAVWEALARRLDPAQLIELTVLVGHYHLTAFYQNALRMKPRETNAGLFAT